MCMLARRPPAQRLQHFSGYQVLSTPQMDLKHKWISKRGMLSSAHRYVVVSKFAECKKQNL